MDKSFVFRKISKFWEQDLSDVIDRDINIKLPIKLSKAVTIIWPRRSWKTFVCFQLIKNLIKSWIDKRQIIYFNFEDERLLNINSKDLDIILQVYFEVFPDNYSKELFLFLDEIQEVKDWEKFVRRILDEYKNIKIILTWSSSKFLSKDIATSLRGRTITYKIYPLSFKEVLKFKRLEYLLEKSYLLEREEFLLQNIFFEVLKYGFFPEVVIEDNQDLKESILKNYYDVIFYKDIIERWNIKAFAKAKEFRNIITSLNTWFLSIRKIAKSFNLNEKTLKNWLELFEDAFFVKTLNNFNFSIRKQVKSRKKIYLIDNWFYNLVYWFGFENLGINFENIVFLELIKYWLVENETIFYLKGKDFDVDFFILKSWKGIPVQVSYNIDDKDTLKREVDNLNKFMKKYNVEKGVLIVYDKRNIKNFPYQNIQILDFWEFLKEKNIYFWF